MNNLKNKIDKLLEKLLILTTNKRYLEEIHTGEEMFINALPEGTVKIGFNDWLILDYSFENGGSFIDELFASGNLSDDEKILLNSIKNSIFSVFTVMESERHTFIKDVFTREDYLIENISDIDRNPIIARVIKYNKKNYIIDTINDWAEESEKSIRKSIYEKYNEFCSKFQNISIDEFIKKNPIAIYKYLMIYKDIEMKSVFQDEEFFLHVATYNIVNKDIFNDSIAKSKNIIFQTDDYKNDIYELYIDDMILCEIEVINDNFEIECRNKEDLIDAMIEIDKVFDKNVIKLKEEILNVEDLI
jgi:hypothetical protein